MRKKWGVGDSFGDWTLLEKTARKSGTNCFWKMRCKCGTVRETARLGLTRSCKACADKKHEKYAVGQVVGSWTLIERTEEFKKGTRNRYWFLRCECGYVTRKHTGDFVSPRVQRCKNCANKSRRGSRTAPRNFIEGRRFGKLTVIERTSKKYSGQFLWRCKCDCGGERLCRSDHLKRKKHPPRHCGCDDIRVFHGLSKTAEYACAAVNKRRTRKRGNGGSHTLVEWLALCEKQGHRCAACKRKVALTRDHIVALGIGGSDDIENIQGLCKSCNCSKQTRGNVEFMQSKGFLI